MRAALLFLLLVCPAAAAIAGPTVEVQTGFLKGESYLQLSQAERSVYAMGLIDGLFASAFYGADEVQLRKLKDCTAGWTNTQLAAVLDQHVRADPSHWQYPMNVLAVNAMVKACPGLRPQV